MRVKTNSHLQIHCLPRPCGSPSISQRFSHIRTCCRLSISPRNCSIKSLELGSVVPRHLNAHSKNSRVLLTRCVSKFSESFDPDPGQNYGKDPNEVQT
uniref:Uncharacterized protein n=1 Tax=Rhizophora mucronata TaxID=61149 RepID=A0A2P2JJW4_RHIMU